MDPLSGRFAQAMATAAKLIEPQIQPICLGSGTLTSPQEVRDWLKEQKVRVEKLKDVPIVIQ